jgi:uncharacterized membrane-anchored protein YhcB (DUF1043 family)
VLEKVKNWALAGLGVLVGLLFGILTLYKERLGAANRQLEMDKAKEGLADAVTKQNQAEHVATDTVAAFDELASEYERRHRSGEE